MKGRKVLLAFCAISAAMRAEEPHDYFANLKDRTFVEVDRSYVVKEKPVRPGSPALFRVRHLLLRVKAWTGDAERRWWPTRSLFLIEADSGNRFVAEITSDVADLEHLDAPRAWTRLSSASRGLAFESWATVDPRESDASNANEPGTLPEQACAGTRYRFIGGGQEISRVRLQDIRSRTVSVALAEIRDAVFSRDEVRELDRLRSLDIPSLGGGSGPAPGFSSGIRIAWSYLFMERSNVPPDRRDLALVPEDAPPGDLAPWRTLTYLPQDLPPFPALPPESPMQ